MFNLREINLIILPNWSQSEEYLIQKLSQVIQTIANHPASQKMTVLIYINAIAREDVELLLSGIVMNLLIEEKLARIEEIELSFLENFNSDQWTSLLPHLNTRIILEDKYEKSIALKLCSQISYCDLERFQKLCQEDFIFNLAENLFKLNKWEQAIEEYQRLLQLKFSSSQIYLRLANCFQALKLQEKELDILQQGIRFYPQDVRIYFQLMVALQRSGSTQKAKQIATKATNNFPNNYTFKLFHHLLVPRLYECQEDIISYRKRFIQGLSKLTEETFLYTPEEKQNALKGIKRFTNFYLPYQAQNDKSLQIQYGQLVHKILLENYPQWIVPRLMPSIDENHLKIRLGYASAYLHSYSGSLWLTGWLRYCDRTQFEVYCYYTGNSPDPVTQQFRNYSDVFYHIPGNQDAVCQQIINDNLHILVFPEIGMDPPTIQLAGLRLAPIQCVAWGHPVTTGLKTLDYFLSSELMEPANAQEHYSEKLIRLPNIGVAYPQPQIPPLIKTRQDFNLEEDKILYLCCQAPFKYLPQYDYILPEIASRVPTTQFLFLRGNLLKQRLKKAFSAKDLDYESYCLFITIPERDDYLAINRLCDIYLDTLTWSGGNTSLEAIACHLPIVTCPGEFMRGRHSDSFLKMIEVTDTIAKDEKEYIDIAVKLGLDVEWRNTIIDKLRSNSHRLYDDREAIRSLETFYQQVVKDALAKQEENSN